MYRIIAIFIVTLATCFISIDSYAKRFGSGKSFGMQRSVSQPHSGQTMQQPHMSNPISAVANKGKWLAALTGLAAGGLLSYFLMGHGLGAGALSWIAIAGVIFLLVQFLRHRKGGAAASLSTMQQQSETRSPGYDSTSHHYQSQSQPSSQQSTTTNNPIFYQGNVSNVTADFNVDEFLRDAKSKFIRLQTAYDQKNLADIREFTVPEVFSEIQLQLSERGQNDNYTEVVQLQAELLESVTEFQVPIASVKFSGTIKEAKDALPSSFNEIWHFRKEIIGGWKVAGIQQ